MKTLFTTLLLCILASFAIAQGSLDSGLVAFYPFNGNAIDESGNGYNGIASGATMTTDRFNQPDKAYNFVFNGYASDKISVDNTSNLNFSSDGFSISAWVKFSGAAITGNNYPILSKHICGEQSGYILMLYNGKLTFWLAGAGAWNILSTPDDYTDNNWHQVVAVYNGAEESIYVDGSIKNSMTFNYDTFNNANWALGGYNGCNGGFNGKVDEIKIYNRPLSNSEILENYNATRNTLVAFFPFNGNAIDESGNGHDGIINGNCELTADRFGSPDKAYTFLNQASCISLANSVNMNLQGGFTINAWIKYKSGGQKVIVCKHVCGVPNGFVFLIDNDGQLRFYICNSSWSIVETNTSFTEDQWYMVSATFDSTMSTQKIYIDGQLSASGSASYYGYSSNPISIGDSYQNNCVPGNMDGVVDEVKIYSRPLNAEEILEEYNNTYTDLVLFLPFNGNANDASGNGNNGTVEGASLTQDRFGVGGQAYSFNGTDNFITIADNPNLFCDELTISWWYKMTEILGGERVVIGWVDGGHRYQQFFNGGQLSYLNGYNVAQPGMYFNPIYGLNDLNVWKHVVVTYQKTGASTSTTSIYVDGDLKQTDNHTLAMDYVPGIEFFIGKNHNGNFFKGSLDDFRIFNRILNDTEILALYNDSTTYFPPLEDGLVAYWPFNGTTYDSTYNNNDGINHNGSFNKDRYGNNNNSIYFTGTDSYVEGFDPGNNLPAGNSPRSFTTWIKENSFHPWGNNIFHYGLDQPAPTNFHFYTTDNIRIGNGYDYGVVFGNTVIVDSTWHFVAGVYEGGTEHIAKVFVDGKLDATGIISTEPNTILGSNWKIGRFMTGSNNFDGNIDELKIYNIALSDQQIRDNYKETTTAPNLIFPGNDSTLINPLPTLVLDWDSTVTATSYRLIIANDSLFNTIVHDTLTNTSLFDFDDWVNVNIDKLYWKVRTINDGGIGPWSETNRFNIILTDVKSEDQLPTEFALMQNYPNPFNPSTVISYELPKESKVELKVYDIIGNEIAMLVNEEKPAGKYKVNFDATNLSSGIYLYKITAGDFVQTKKMILMK